METLHILRDEGHIVSQDCPCKPIRHGYLLNHAFDPEIRRKLAKEWVWSEQWHYVRSGAI